MQPKPKNNSIWHLLGAAAFWLVVWQLASVVVGQELLFPSPLAVLRTLATLAGQGRFWQSVLGSTGLISIGFFGGLATGVLLAWAANASRFVRVLLSPLMQLMRATPVASFVILVLLWVGNRYLSTVISFVMVLPVIYGGTLTGIQSTEGKLLEMAQVFRIPFWRRVRAIYLPSLMPSLYTACELALGLCWKSGVAAEVIGQPDGTIGERLFTAKIYLLTPEVFAWTAVIIVLSWLFTRLVKALLHLFATRVAKGGAHG